MLSINMVSAITWILSGAEAAFIINGNAASRAISHPIKWVIALPGSLGLNFIKLTFLLKSFLNSRTYCDTCRLMGICIKVCKCLWNDT